MERDWQQETLEVLSGLTPEGIVTGFVVVVEFTDTDTDRALWGVTMAGQGCHRTLGLLDWAATRERHLIRTALDEEGDG